MEFFPILIQIVTAVLYAGSHYWQSSPQPHSEIWMIFVTSLSLSSGSFVCLCKTMSCVGLFLAWEKRVWFNSDWILCLSPQLKTVETLLGNTAKVGEVIVLGMITQLKEVSSFLLWSLWSLLIQCCNTLKNEKTEISHTCPILRDFSTSSQCQCVGEMSFFVFTL